MAKVYERIASLIVAIQNCEKPGFNGHPDYPQKHIDALQCIARECLPSGSGFDRGCSVDIDASSAVCIAVNTAFHHMDDNGYYCGWTDHVVRIRAHLAFGFTVSISGRNFRGIKDYMSDVFYHVMQSECVEGV